MGGIMNCLCVQASMKERSTKCRRLMASPRETKHARNIISLSLSFLDPNTTLAWPTQLWLLPICSILVSRTLGYTATCVCFLQKLRYIVTNHRNI